MALESNSGMAGELQGTHREAPLMGFYPLSVQVALVMVFVPGVLAFSLLPVIWQPSVSGSGNHSPWGDSPMRLNLNRATRWELAQVPGLGPTTAAKIIDYREANGPFQSFKDLDNVPGFGPGIISRVKKTLYVSPEKGVSSGKGKEPKAVDGNRVNPNSASFEELSQLPGIGQILANRIIQAREKCRFEKIEDLRKVPGIGQKTLEKIRPYLIFPAPVSSN